MAPQRGDTPWRYPQRRHAPAPPGGRAFDEHPAGQLRLALRADDRFSRAVRIGDRVVVSGTAPVWPDGSVDPDPAAQARRCFEIIETALREAGASLADVVRTRMFVTDAAQADAIGAVHGEVFADVRPAATMVVVAGLLDPRWVVEIEAEALDTP